MDNDNDVNRVEEEPIDTGSNSGDNYVLDLVNSCKAEKFETLSFFKSPANYRNKVMALQEQLNGKIFVDFECKYVKSEPKSLSTTICKTEYKSCQANLKIENYNPTNYMNGKSLII
ncbi:uncharacterized protein LOC111694138 [Trichogramma pretiosum]|uniref:uncharacterized protein LOC111694138 n=1 Tax=Trichogramma pretiosum TaxID=7493 RepID=UPI000C71A84D|nr:uncharacterized protein LOC111694138 [Trichogramma pretiosum]